uniref:Uncharacterized protein n=1 Tax=Escherichia coli TaxID=562 RepID=A0A0N9DZR5_ECOLX|nr:hypothetical protein AZ95_0010 [Escherichia coli]
MLTSLLFISYTIGEYDIKINTYPTIVCKYIKEPALKVFLFYKKQRVNISYKWHNPGPEGRPLPG